MVQARASGIYQGSLRLALVGSLGSPLQRVKGIPVMMAQFCLAGDEDLYKLQRIIRTISDSRGYVYADARHVVNDNKPIAGAGPSYEVIIGCAHGPEVLSDVDIDKVRIEAGYAARNGNPCSSFLGTSRGVNEVHNTSAGIITNAAYPGSSDVCK